MPTPRSLRRSTRAFLAALLVATLAPVFAADAPLGELLDVAGRQRMLTQRIAGNFVLAGLDGESGAARARIDAAVERFDAQLRLLGESPLVRETAARELERVRALWLPFRAAAAGRPGREAVRDLVALDEQLLAACDAVVRAIEHATGHDAPTLVNVAGRQRMLSQRLAKLYMLQAAGISGFPLLEDATRARAEFEQALGTLRSAPESTGIIATGLASAELQWAWFSSALEVREGQFFPLIVADAAEKILAAMEQVTAAYAALPAP